jgi:hypothetical protein
MPSIIESEAYTHRKRLNARVTTPIPKLKITAEDMKIGDLAVSADGIVLRTYEHWVLLNNPGTTWAVNTGSGKLNMSWMSVRILEPGEKVELVVQ